MSDTTKSEIHRLVFLQLDWKVFLESARWHGVVPLVFNNLKNIPERHQIPDEIIEDLKSDYRKNLVRNTIIFAKLDRVLAAFEKHRIQIIPIKGAAFTREIYGDIGLRPMSDIDILVKRADVYHAENVVHELGYKQVGKTDYHNGYINGDDNFYLEIHWAVASPKHPSLIRAVDSKLIGTWWSRALPYNSKFQNILSLNPVDRIYLLASHFFKHRFIRPNKVFDSRGALIQLCDMYNVTNYYKNDIDWEKLKIKSRQIGLYKIVGVTLAIVKEIFGLQNDETMDFLNDWKLGGLDREIIDLVSKRLFMREDKLAPVPFAFINAQTEISFQKRFKRIFKEIFPNPEALSSKLKRPIRSRAFYLIYLTRPFILLKRYGKTFLGMRRLKEEGILKRWIDAQD
jgi:hypothetical protein